MTEHEWHVGQRVVVRNGLGTLRLETIDRLTETQVVTEHGRWRRRDGYRVGGAPSYSSYIRPATPGDIDHAERADALVRIRLATDKPAAQAVPLADLQAILATLTGGVGR